MDISRFIGMVSQSKVGPSGASVTFPCGVASFFVETMSEDFYRALLDMEEVLSVSCNTIVDGVAVEVSFRVKTDDGEFRIQGF